MRTEEMSFEDDESDDEKEEMHILRGAEQEVCLRKAQLYTDENNYLSHQIMCRSMEILNDPYYVQILAGSLQTPNAVRDVCRIGHNLLLSNKMALHKYRYWK